MSAAKMCRGLDTHTSRVTRFDRRRRPTELRCALCGGVLKLVSNLKIMNGFMVHRSCSSIRERRMMMPKVWNMKHDECPPAVYVGRPTKYGNPFLVSKYGREEAIQLYIAWLAGKPELVEAAKRELRGKDLKCWCAPQACHADVLLEIANS